MIVLITKSSYNILDTTEIENLVNETITINKDISKTIGNGFLILDQMELIEL